MEKEETGGGWFSGIAAILRQATANPVVLPFVLITAIGIGALYWSVKSHDKLDESNKNIIENCEKESDAKQQQINEDAKEKNELIKQLLQSRGYVIDSSKKR